MNERRYDERENFYRTDDDNHAENESGTDGGGNPGFVHENVSEKAWLRLKYARDTSQERIRDVVKFQYGRKAGNLEKKSGDISSVSREKQRMKFQAETASLEGQMLNCSLLSAPRG